MALQVMKTCSLIEYKLFGGTYCLHILNISSNSDEQFSQTCSLILKKKTINTIIITNYRNYFMYFTSKTWLLINIIHTSFCV